MSSPDPELRDGFILPAWMKAKPVKEFEPFATSPPSADDSFFFIKYPNTDVVFGKTNMEPAFRATLNEPPTVAAANYNPREKDWSKHTKPCQDVIHGIVPKSGSTLSANKEAGKENDFQEDDVTCGTSVVKVAHQMVVSSRSVAQRGFTVATPSADAGEEMASGGRREGRRGSRSLPATPVHTPPGSPHSRRRKMPNRYFTSPFEPVEDGAGGARSWLAAALLGYKKDLSASSCTLHEEDAMQTRLQGVTLAESVENLGPSPKSQDPPLISSPTPPQTSAGKSQAFRPKPSELREMNFWSPTSM